LSSLRHVAADTQSEFEAVDLLLFQKHESRGQKMKFENLWTDEMVAQLNAMWVEGHSGTQIANAINATHGKNLSRNAVIGKAHRLGLSTHAAATIRKKSPEIDMKTNSFRTCQFILNDDMRAPEYCGDDLRVGSAYCAKHHEICFRSETKSEKGSLRSVPNYQARSM